MAQEDKMPILTPSHYQMIGKNKKKFSTSDIKFKKKQIGFNCDTLFLYCTVYYTG